MTAPFYFLTTDYAASLVNTRAADAVAHARCTFDVLGLGCVVDDHGGRIVAQPLQNGPGGFPGLLLSVSILSGRPQKAGYFPDEQTWHHVRQFRESIDGVRGLHVGWPTASPPTPADLDNGNPAHVGGITVQLSDGNDWTMPELREPLMDGLPLPTDWHRPKLPTTLGHALDGSLTRTVKRDYVTLWEESGLWFDRWLQLLDGGGTFDAEEALSFALRCLQLRYRLPAVLADALQLIDNSQLQNLIDIAIGWPELLHALRSKLNADDSDDDQKKTAAAGTVKLNGDSGREDSGPGIDRREPNSISPSTAAADTEGRG